MSGIGFIFFFQYLWVDLSRLNEDENTEELKWKKEFQQYEQILALLDGVHIPLNDSFNTKDLSFEVGRFERYRVEYLEQSEQMFKILKKNKLQSIEFEKTLVAIASFQKDYFITASNQFYFLQKKRELDAFKEYSKAITLNQSIRDNFLELKNSSVIRHFEQTQRYQNFKKNKFNYFRILIFALLIICIFIYMVFKNLLKTIQSSLQKQKELETSLVEKNLFYKTMLSNMTEGLVVQDNTGKIILCNESSAFILERTMDQLLTKSSYDPDWQAIKTDGSPYPSHEHPAVQVLSGKFEHVHGVMGLKFQDRIKWIEINSTPIYSEGREILYSLTTFFDVTLKTNQMNISLAVIQLKEAYLRYQHSLKDFYKFITFSLHKVFKADLVFVAQVQNTSNGLKLSMSNSLFEFFSDDHFVNYDIWANGNEFISQDFVQRIGTSIHDKDLNVLSYKDERMNFPQLSSFDHEIESFSLIKFCKNDLLHTVIFLAFKENHLKRDIGVNRQSYLQALDQMISTARDEEELRKEKEKLQFTLLSSGVYFFEINLSQRKIIADESFFRKLYFTTNEIDISIEQFIEIFSSAEENKAEVEEMINALFNKNEFFEHRLFLKTITNKDEIFILKAKRSIDNDEVSYFCTLIDDTKNANLEDEIQKQKDIVYQNQKLAAIGELAAGVGHEINNPLTIISGHIQKIRKQVVTETQQVFAEEILQGMEKSVLRIKNIVSGLRKFSHTNAIEVEVVDLHLCLTDVVDMVRDIYLADGVVLNFISKVDEFYIVGNFGKIQQVVINLMNNARDALKEVNKKEKIIDVSLQKNGTKLLLEVMDNGTGIPDEAKDKIFNAFYTTKDVGEGTGLGLSIVHNIIKEHNAKIDITSKLGEFTKFTITFDQFVMDHVAHKENTIGEEIGPGTKLEDINDLKAILAGKSILVVEDEPAIRDIIKDILEEYSLNIVEVENGLMALEKIAQIPFDLVLTDMKMPVMSGIELLEKVKEFENIELKRFIIMSGGVNLALENLKLELGFSDILNKPFNDKDLILKVYVTLKKLNVFNYP